MYSIKQRIMAGELVDYYFIEDHPKIGNALLLVFNMPPVDCLVRPRDYYKYTDLLYAFRQNQRSEQDN